jgi:hypothetical protein
MYSCSSRSDQNQNQNDFSIFLNSFGQVPDAQPPARPQTGRLGCWLLGAALCLACGACCPPAHLRARRLRKWLGCVLRALVALGQSVRACCTFPVRYHSTLDLVVGSWGDKSHGTPVQAMILPTAVHCDMRRDAGMRSKSHRTSVWHANARVHLWLDCTRVAHYPVARVPPDWVEASVQRRQTDHQACTMHTTTNSTTAEVRSGSYRSFVGFVWEGVYLPIHMV